MSEHMGRHAIMRKTKQIGLLTVASRILAVCRAAFQIRFLGMSGLSDAFLVAFRIPNFLRKVFAEGALSAAFVPVFIQLIKDGKRSRAHSLMSYMFALVQGLLAMLTVFVWWQPRVIISLIAPGFAEAQIMQTIPFVRLLFPFILLISSSALFAGALQSVNCFGVTAFAPVVLNVTYIGGLLVCIWGGYAPDTFVGFILLGGVLHVLLHAVYFFMHSFRFGRLTKSARPLLGTVMKRFIPALLGMSVLELNALVDGIFASYLVTGSVSILHYGYRFATIPFGVFGVAFATVMLSHFARTSTYARSRFSFYLIESAKMIALVTLPMTVFMWYMAPVIFKTFLWGKADAARIVEAAWGLKIYVLGLGFFCLNRIMMSLSYALHNSWLPIAVTVGATVLNIIGNIIALYYGSYIGIAVSTVLSVGLCTAVFMLEMLRRYHAIKFYSDRLWWGLGVVLLCFVPFLCVLYIYNEHFLYFGLSLLSYFDSYLSASWLPIIKLVQYWIAQVGVLGVIGAALYWATRTCRKFFYFWG